MKPLSFTACLACRLFAGAFLLEVEYLYREKLAVGILSVLGTLFSTAGLALLMHWMLPVLGMPVPCSTASSSAHSSPDPIAVLEMLHRVGVPKDIQAQLAGESLFNDGVGAVLFLAVLDASQGAAPTIALCSAARNLPSHAHVDRPAGRPFDSPRTFRPRRQWPRLDSRHDLHRRRFLPRDPGWNARSFLKKFRTSAFSA